MYKNCAKAHTRTTHDASLPGPRPWPRLSRRRPADPAIVRAYARTRTYTDEAYNTLHITHITYIIHTYIYVQYLSTPLYAPLSLLPFYAFLRCAALSRLSL
jgi:hypothetical protein